MYTMIHLCTFILCICMPPVCRPTIREPRFQRQTLEKYHFPPTLVKTLIVTSSTQNADQQSKSVRVFDGSCFPSPCSAADRLLHLAIAHQTYLGQWVTPHSITHGMSCCPRFCQGPSALGKDGIEEDHRLGGRPAHSATQSQYQRR